jgi:hypothetical protein
MTYTLQQYLDENYNGNISDLQTLSLYKCNITSLECDKVYPNILTLNCNNNNLMDLKGLENFPNVNTLDLCNNGFPLLDDINSDNVHKISPMLKLKKLHLLHYQNENRISLSVDLEEFKKWTNRILRQTKIKNILE